MAAVDNTSRANIRIEIKNDFTEEMVVTEESNTLSEGELEDDDSEAAGTEEQEPNTTKNKIFLNTYIATNRKDNYWTNNDGGFTTGVDIFAKGTQEKLQTRAQRFGLDPDECKSMTDQQLQELHESLGISEEDEINTRFEAIHMYGTKEMSTQDVFSYFGRYGPSMIEWINDECCNVVWFDRISAARAFHGLSSPIAGMPAKGSCNPFKLEVEEEKPKSEKRESGRSILLINQNREVELYDENTDTALKEYSNEEQGLVHVSDIPIPVPPGYWRLGVPHPKAEYILFRFAKRSDKKPVRAEKFSEYYKKYGNPNYGGIKGLISESKKRRMKGYGKSGSEEGEQAEVVKGNPWGNLAKNWNNDIKEYSEEPVQFPTKPTKSIYHRLGSSNKRSHEEIENGATEENEKKSKVPRMRMYADEEEVKIEKAKQLKKIRELEEIEELLMKNTTRPQEMDLRNRIGKQNIPRHAVVADRLTDCFISNTFKLRSDTVENISLKQRLQRIPHTLPEDHLNVQQRSKVTVIVKRRNEPSMASTIWARLDKEKRVRSKDDDDEEESLSDKSDDSESSDEDSDSEKSKKNKFLKTERPGFGTGNLKSRLGLSTEHKSPLRIEINNDHYKKS